jgi:hypothetical protein
MTQNGINTHFLAVLDHFSYKNRPIDLVRYPFSNLDTGTYIRPTWGSVCTFLGPFGGAQMPQNRRKKAIFWLFRTISFTRMGLFIRLGAYFQASILKHTSYSLAGFFEHLFGSVWGCPNAPKQHKNFIFWMVRTTYSSTTGLMIWLGAFFEPKQRHTYCPFTGLCVPFWVHLGVVKCPKTA